MDEFSKICVEDEAIANVLDENLRSFARLWESIDESLPAGRCRSLVLTKLQEAAMWASRGVAEGYRDELLPQSFTEELKQL